MTTRPTTHAALDLYDDPELHADDCPAVRWHDGEAALTRLDCNCALASLVKVEAEATAAVPLDVERLAAMLRAAYWAHRVHAGGWHDAPQWKPCQDECFADITERAADDVEVLVGDRALAAAPPPAEPLDVERLARALRGMVEGPDWKGRSTIGEYAAEIAAAYVAAPAEPAETEDD